MSSDPFGPNFGNAPPPIVQGNPYAEQPANPYASPTTDYSMLLSGQSGGVFQLGGNRMVLHRMAMLPARCIKTGQPAETVIKKTLYWHTPWLLLLIFLHVLIYAVVALIVRKSMTFSFPITYRARGKLRLRLGLGLFCLLMAFVTMITGFVMGDSRNGGDGFFIFLGMLGFFGLLITSIVLLFLARLVTPTKITDQYTVVKGVSPEYLALLPIWPGGNDVP